MPHAEIKYTQDITLDAPAILERIEQIILEHDDGAGACKGRAFRVDAHHHTHVDIKVALLVKAHRDDAFSNKLLDSLKAAVMAMIPQSCHFSLELIYSGPFYFTGTHEV
jgi:5-carboxymethyl-2-hydroxymuconate isomerase